MLKNYSLIVLQQLKNMVPEILVLLQISHGFLLAYLLFFFFNCQPRATQVSYKDTWSTTMELKLQWVCVCIYISISGLVPISQQEMLRPELSKEWDYTRQVVGRIWWKSVHLAWASQLIHSRIVCCVNYSQAQWCVQLVVRHDTDIFWWSLLQNSESACFIPAFNHWLLWCKPGKFSAEWGTLEMLLVGAGFLSSLPCSSGSPFVLEESWVSSPELIHQTCHIW